MICKKIKKKNGKDMKGFFIKISFVFLPDLTIRTMIKNAINQRVCCLIKKAIVSKKNEKNNCSDFFLDKY